MIKIAFAGFRHAHIFALYNKVTSNPDVLPGGSWEEDDEARRNAAAIIGPQDYYETYDQLLGDPEVDAVAIGDYYGARGQLAIRALKAGKHVISDKPLCTSLNELTEIADLATAGNLKIGCMLDMRYGPYVGPLRDLLAAGDLGDIKSISFGGQHPLMYGTRPSWYFEEGKHGGVINDIAIHGMDLIAFATGLTLKNVLAARCWNAFAREEPRFLDSAQFMLELSNGAGVIADVSYASPNSCGYTLPFYWRFFIWGTKGVVTFSGPCRDLQVAIDGEDGVRTIPGRDSSQDYLKDFIADIRGEGSGLQTIDVIRATQDTLLIQKAADLAGSSTTGCV